MSEPSNGRMDRIAHRDHLLTARDEAFRLRLEALAHSMELLVSLHRDNGRRFAELVDMTKRLESL